MRKPRCLFVCTTFYNATSLKRVSDELSEFDCFFTPVYSENNFQYKVARFLGLCRWTTLNNGVQRRVLREISSLDVQIDFGGRQEYDLFVLGNDFYVPQNITRSSAPAVLVQEGWTWLDNPRRRLVEKYSFPPWVAGADGTGLSHRYDSFCVASDGMRSRLIMRGIASDKVVTTGLPGLDDVVGDFKRFDLLKMDPDIENFVLLTTHPGREYFEGEDRKKLLNKTRRIAQGQQIVVKFHPNENKERAEMEIKKWLPEAIIVNCDVNLLISKCDVLVTTQSTTIYYAMLLGKRIVSTYPPDDIRPYLPIQNGCAARNIANVCREVFARANP